MSERTFRLYDTLSRQVQEVRPIEPGHLRFYSCGPTVYSYAHIGNFRTFLSGDLVIRTAEAIGWRVTYASNITDVGHLTEDDVADAEGEDKMERALKSKEGEQFANVWDLAEHYAEAFKQDWAALNLREPAVRPKATQHMREQIAAIESLIQKGHAYETPTGVYFDVRSFEGYGKLSGNRDQESLYRAVREVKTDDNKRFPADFALWKKDEKHLMQWYSPWGWGFPGWHIECSAMARAYLGDTIDLHAGGEDLIFPHHECEIAQSEGLTGKPFAHHWMHTRFLMVNGEKMAKSAGNFYTVRDLLAKGADPLAIRYALISGVYGKQFNFTDQTLIDATGNVERFKRCDDAVGTALQADRDGDDSVGPTLDALYNEALDAMCDDLNTAVALAKALEGSRVILRESERLNGASARSAQQFLDRINDLLGIVRHDRAGVPSAASTPSVDEEWVEAKIAERAEAKAAKDFARADALRSELAARGIELRDGPQGTSWVRRPLL
jgi:cysteinyl-tRNA synthetase